MPMMNQEQAFVHWSKRLLEWSAVASEPSEHATGSAQRAITDLEGLSEMAKTAVDSLLQAGSAPTEVAIAIAQGAYLTFAEMIRYYGQEGS